jgi:3-deoxy-7-phosphoheptulonate synthase
MIDLSHANSSKRHEKQLDVARDVAGQIAAGAPCIMGVMVESYIHPGAQKFTPGKDEVSQLEYGKSITDPCLGWDNSETILRELSHAVTARRGRAKP